MIGNGDDVNILMPNENNESKNGAPPQFPSSFLKMDKIMNHRRGEKGLSIHLAWDNSILQHAHCNDMKKIFIEAATILVDLIPNRLTHNVVCYHRDTISGGESTTSLFTLPSYEMLCQTYKKSCTNSKLRRDFFSANLPVENPLASDSIFFLSAAQMELFGIQSEQKSFSNQCFMNLEDTKHDLLGVCLHELTETLGRMSGFQDEYKKNYKSILDLSNFILPGHRNVNSYTPGSYFSIDCGESVIAYFNKDSSGDSSDWDSEKHVEDCCKAISQPNQKESLTLLDLTTFEILGYNLAPIEYKFDQIKIPIGCTFLSPLSCNYSIIKGIPSFSISPQLPEGLLFSTVNGSISGTTKIISPSIRYIVSFETRHHIGYGEFELSVIATQAYLLAQQSKNKQSPQETISSENDDDKNGLSTATIVMISLLATLALIAIVGVSIFATRKHKK
jgi:hypothetical protein